MLTPEQHAINVTQDMGEWYSPDTRDLWQDAIANAIRAAVSAAVAEEREAERERCCQDICRFCADGISVIQIGPYWGHDVPLPRQRRERRGG
jgi:hypothetical protein